MFRILDYINRGVWGVPLLVLILGTGLFISVRCGFPQIKLFPEAFKAFCGQLLGRKGDEGKSSYRALCTALAATVGTGNLAGVAGAIAIGGPGAIFWMWICGLVGMATKFAEASLAVLFQKRESDNARYGGPMYMILQGLNKHWHWMAYIYAFFGVVASFGVGNVTQVNAVLGGISSIADVFGIEFPKWMAVLCGIGLAIVIYRILSGGLGFIGDCTEKLVPFMTVGYVILATYVIVRNANAIPGAFCSIISGAFSPAAVTGGMVGSALTTLRVGAARGVFTNEAGMGTAAIAHSTSRVKHPVQQGLMGIIEVFLDTILICTLTALVILCSGVAIPYGEDTGIKLTAQAFVSVCGGWVTIPIGIALCCFALATILGWGMYGARCAAFLFGDKAWRKFVIFQALVIVLGAVLSTGTVWILSDIVNGLMAIPNLIALLMLCHKLEPLTAEYYKRRLVKRPDAKCQNLSR